MEKEEALLKVNNLEVSYDDIQILKGLSLSIQKGEIFGIVGESGCGKSTMLSAILNMMENGGKISKGEIIFEGKDISKYNKEEMRRLRGNRLGVVFQNPGETLNPSRKIETQFYEALRAHEKITKQEAGKIAADMLKRLNLEHGDKIIKKYPFQLSGGMNQRVALSLAMIMEPSLLLADEPTSALDVTVQAQAIGEMMKLRDNFGTSILIVTHNMGVISHMTDRFAVMYAGRIVECGDKNEILSNPVHPYTRSLLGAIPDFSGDMPTGLEGSPPPFGSIKCGCEFESRCPCCEGNCTTKELKLIDVSKGNVGKEHFAVCSKAG
ncbi:oligopeptide/dipeptide ABC transporter, ATP-binding protein, C-terminal domain-containing protein [Acetitomaculum ruminis DSM 5522]|uniref:Oligopeptide/dipeptide ABC transporter, ATP-binding protein, C-terminal domain-containing protein n=1 Tax=Acetitomaculum ruminis DSM 5522 TaxID=1120918 RepID=A0A1I1A9T1_9FIRM|nr:ABC transporter ATP-binding protein [Acetitomaculum ruminis]SFB34734.1 oligopeptide/dipeptide ABC transporter, ATP-binding protein, C-terminal domain-containing protein [Acetitomaculum ruminis DSM 5522]